MTRGTRPAALAALAALAMGALLVLVGCGSGSAGDTGAAALDSRTTTWFDTLCTGLAPVKSAGTAIAGTGPSGASDPKAQLDAAVTGFTTIGDALVATAKSLAALPPPTFDGGDEVAARMVTVLSTAGPAVRQAAATLAATPATDEQAVTAAIQTATTAMTNSVSGLDVGTSQLDPATQAAIKQIPSCAAVGFGGT